KKYMHLVWHELMDPNYDYTKFKQQNLGGVWGGASRGVACPNQIFPMNGLKTSADSVKFKWNKSGTTNTYSFLIYDDKGDEILKMPVQDTVKLVNLKVALNSRPGKYY